MMIVYFITKLYKAGINKIYGVAEAYKLFFSPQIIILIDTVDGGGGGLRGWET